MAGPQKLTGKYAEDYCRKWPKSGDMTVAKLLYRDFPQLYMSLDSARASVRYYRGHIGKLSRGKALKKDTLKPLTNETNAYKLPESMTVKVEVFNLPTSIKKVLYLTDLHFPYQDNQAIEAAVAYGKREGVDCVFLGGDLLDFYQLSFHEKDPRKTSISNELQAGKAFFAYLRNEFPKATIYYIPGNHEVRLERYLKIKAPELLDVPEFQLDTFLKVREHDIIFIPYGSKVYFGKLLVEHGDKMKGTGGVNPARTLALKFKRHTICGHFHRTSESIQKVYDGEAFITYSVGCLCDLEPAFFPVNDHTHGCALIEMLPGGEFIVHNKKISNGKVY